MFCVSALLARVAVCTAWKSPGWVPVDETRICTSCGQRAPKMYSCPVFEVTLTPVTSWTALFAKLTTMS